MIFRYVFFLLVPLIFPISALISYDCVTTGGYRVVKNDVSQERLSAKSSSALTHFQKIISQFKATCKTQMIDTGLWVGQPYTGTSFGLFAQKLIVPTGSNITFFGDLHGNYSSLERILDNLKRKGLLDQTLTIKDPTFYMVFLGDYVDRGSQGVQVLSTIMQLKIANPYKVFLVRGNHEDTLLNKVYGFEEELQTTFGTLTAQQLEEIYSVYNFMPAVLFLGSGTISSSNMVVCAHGGWEIGYTSDQLLEAPGRLMFEKVERLGRKDEVRALPAWLKKPIIDTIPASEIVDFTPEQPTLACPVGFMWTDVIAQDSCTKVVDYIQGRGWVYGKLLTKYILEKNSTEHHKLRAIFRAHQHYGDMLVELRKHKGLVSLWDGMVYTVLSASVEGIDFPYASYVIVKTAPAYADWTIEHQVV